MTLRRSRRLLVSGLAGGLAVALAAGGCTHKPSLPGTGGDAAVRTAAQNLAAALGRQDVSGLAWSGATGQQVQTRWRSATAPLGTANLTAAVTDASARGSSGTATLELAWIFPGVSTQWRYPVTVRFVRVDQGWQDVWSPSLVQPDLGDGAQLTMTRQQGQRGDILAADGTALMTERAVERIGIDKARVPASKLEASATALAKLVGIDQHAFAGAVRSAGAEAFVQAIVFRADASDLPSNAALGRIAGAVAIDDQAVLSPSRGFATALLGTVGEASKEAIDRSRGTIAAGDQVGLSGLEARYESQLGGTPSVTVKVVPPSGSNGSSGTPTAGPSASPSPSGGGSAAASPSPAAARTVFSARGSNGRPLTLTLDPALQRLAERVLSAVKPDSALVAIKPSTGQILAAASGPGADGNNSATFGQYPPGSTFKIASSLALLRAGMKPTTPVNCPATLVVNGQTFKNYSDYPSADLGRIDLQTALAQSCNTAFIGSRTKLSGSELSEAAASLGIGTDYDVGFPAYYGSVPAPKSENERAASMIGQARVQASPMAMAGAIASVQAGHTVLPYLVDGRRPTSQARPLSASEATQLRAMLGAVVSTGSGSRLRALEPPAVIAKTGTAEYGTAAPPKTHAWMVAAQGDLAVAVFVADGASGSQTAGPLLQSFLGEA